MHPPPTIGNGPLHWSHCSKKKKCPGEWLASRCGISEFLFFFLHGIASVVSDFLWETMKSENGFTKSRNANRLDTWGSSGMPWEATRPSSSTQRPGWHRVIRPVIRASPLWLQVHWALGPAVHIKDGGNRSGHGILHLALWSQNIPLGFCLVNRLCQARFWSWAKIKLFLFHNTW